MSYLLLVLLIIGLVAFGVFNYHNSCRAARKLIEKINND